MIKQEKGVVAVMSILMLVIVVFLIGVLVVVVNNNYNTAVREKQSDIALYLAKSGAEQARVWLDDGSHWAGSTTTLVNTQFRNNYEFKVAGGSYFVNITTDGTKGQERRIVAIGREAHKKEKRAMELKLSKQIYSNGPCLLGDKIHLVGDAEIHWGPIHALDSIKLEGLAADKRFPRLYSNGTIESIGNASIEDLSVNPPNTDNQLYWSFSSFPQMPRIDFLAYKSAAAAAGPGHQFNSSHTFEGVVDNTPSKYYVAGNCVLRNSYLCGTLVVLGNLEFFGNGQGNVTVDPLPDGYQVEYASAAAVDLFPIPAAPVTVQNMAFDGLIIVQGNVTSTANPSVRGALICHGGTEGWGNLRVYFDNYAYDGILIDENESPVSQVSYQEKAVSTVTQPPWPD